MTAKTPISDQVREIFAREAARIDAWGADMKADIGGALSGALDGLREEMRSGFRDLRADLRAARDDFNAQMDRVEEELREAIAAVRASPKKRQ